MLVLTRKIGEKLRIGDDITITVTQVKGNRVKIGIEAPGNIRIVRGELEEVTDRFEIELPAESFSDTTVALGRALGASGAERTVLASKPEARPVARVLAPASR